MCVHIYSANICPQTFNIPIQIYIYANIYVYKRISIYIYIYTYAASSADAPLYTVGKGLQVVKKAYMS